MVRCLACHSEQCGTEFNVLQDSGEKGPTCDDRGGRNVANVAEANGTRSAAADPIATPLHAQLPFDYP